MTEAIVRRVRNGYVIYEYVPENEEADPGENAVVVVANVEYTNVEYRLLSQRLGEAVLEILKEK